MRSSRTSAFPSRSPSYSKSRQSRSHCKRSIHDRSPDYRPKKEKERNLRSPSRSPSCSKSRSYGKRLKKMKSKTYKYYKTSLSPVPKNNAYIDISRNDQEIIVSGRNLMMTPMMNFHESNLPDSIVVTLQELNFLNPTPIQAQAIPYALEGRDIIGIAQTGSGKTLAFILPALCTVIKQRKRRNDGPIALVLAPTRELARQIQDVCRNFTYGINIKSCCVFGGAPKEQQLKDLDETDICIATPGRLIDFIRNREIYLHNTMYVVLDEADRMLDMGFEPQIRKIFNQLRPDHQTVMFSATWPLYVQKMAKDFLQDYIQIIIGNGELTANHNVQQIVDVMEECEKEEKLLDILERIRNKRENKTIIFAETKKRVDELTNYLWNKGYRYLVNALHGNKTQKERNRVLCEFRKGQVPFLVATSIAARGLDVDDIKMIINFDFPSNAVDYIHRIGRTGRFNKTGRAYTFFTYENLNSAKFLINVLKEANQTVNPKLLDLVEMPRSFNFGRGRKWEEENDYDSFKYSG